MAVIVCDKKREAAGFMQKGLGLCAGNMLHFSCSLGLPYHSHPSSVSNAWVFGISSEYSSLPEYRGIYAGNLVDWSVCTCTGIYRGVCHDGGSAAVLRIKISYAGVVCGSVNSGDSFGFKGNGV